MKTSAQVKSIVNTIAKQQNLKPQEVFQMYFFERVLKRIEKSRYHDIFIIKGGLLIASLIGIESRTTMDMDVTIKGMAVNKDSITSMMKEILKKDTDDGITFSLKDISEIRENDDYEHYRISIMAHIGKINNPMKLDITTGDFITPKEQLYEYPLMFDSGYINIMAYPIETILAEKIETIIRRNIATTRMRDFYDVYVLYKLYQQTINFDLLKIAIQNTSSQRNSEMLIQESKEITDDIKIDSQLKRNWVNYINDNSYVGDIEFFEVIEILEEVLQKIS
ncbi:nucleotidyl transferase AbiEii/AbiGii toxin family protein [Nosocomiicoccus ampullae]|uniref:nucleotidyl transferase AbiEii/AbiGii toxin family protein n=1 Tax=Nosocomiicoccus ampullae TaxID=489910 RepID=UPI002551568F|nr:nucleotidyl transferase AbiEii/AbiGii toxin family protein [Nosocomiicoccus ampullae]MDK6863580.1 nucleotidyl transferase AbiEii/AbiGii toxin family protein [Nosocomiicoccus ampullae]